MKRESDFGGRIKKPTEIDAGFVIDSLQ